MMLSVGKHLRPGLWLTPNWPRKWQKTFKPIRNSDDAQNLIMIMNGLLLTLTELLLQIFCNQLPLNFLMCLSFVCFTGMFLVGPCK